MNSTMKHRLAAAALAGLSLTLAGVATISPAVAQPEQPFPTTPETELTVIKLKYLDVREFLRSVGTIALDRYSSMAFDQRSNSILLNGTAAATQKIIDLVDILDVQIDDDAGDDQIEVYSLAHAAVNGSLISSLYEVLVADPDKGPPDIRLSMDQSTNQLIARGTPDTLGQLRSLLEQLDKPMQEAAAAPDINIRLIWLTTDASGKVPADVKDVTDALADMGITGLSMAAQTIVRTTNRSEFGSEFMTGGTEPWLVQFSGAAETSDAENWTMTVNLHGRRAQSEGPGVPRSVEFETRLSTRAGQFVVLGVSPIGDADSVFVLQIIRAD